MLELLEREAETTTHPESPSPFLGALSKPDVVGLSAMTCEAGCMHELAREIKRRMPDVIVVCSGPPHTSGSTSRSLAQEPSLTQLVPPGRRRRRTSSSPCAARRTPPTRAAGPSPHFSRRG
ncbi:MAG: cobalamin B12-binding domain-containing protein [Planctomycetes bacterium]|nr:cobalamin B12-binding domain-containing protein [Planctomycetota bacterium]